MELLSNGGINSNEYTGTVPGFGDVWVNKFALANIFGFADLKEKFIITYDSEIEDAFNIHLTGKIIKFKRTKEGLYVFQVSKEYKQEIKSKSTGVRR